MQFTLKELLAVVSLAAFAMGLVSLHRVRMAQWNLDNLGAIDEGTKKRVWLVAGDRVKWPSCSVVGEGTVTRVPVIEGRPDRFSCWVKFDCHDDEIYCAPAYLVRIKN